MENHRFFATAPKGVTDLLASELSGIGATSVSETRAGVEFEGTLETAYRACLWSRIANRILLPLEEFPAADPDTLYQGCQDIDWSAHMQSTGTLAVETYLGQPPFTATAAIDDFENRFRGAKDYQFSGQQLSDTEKFEGRYYSSRRAWAGSEAFRDRLLYENLNIFSQEGQLYVNGFGALNLGGGSAYKLQHLSGNSFLVEERNSVISFSEDGQRLTRDIFNNYDKVHAARTPLGFVITILTIIALLWTALISLLINRKRGAIAFEVSTSCAAVLGTAVSLFPFIVFGVFGIHFRLETSVFAIHNLLAWLFLILSVFGIYRFVTDYRSRGVRLSLLRQAHRTAIVATLVVVNYLFFSNDVIRLFES
ncbi:MAG: hypothetical protein ACE37N_01175 [Pseudohongiellaceae bacterium]